MHTSSILVSAPFLPWSLCKSQYYQQIASSMLVLSLLHPLACPFSHANRKGLNADPWCNPTLTLKLSVVPTAHLTTVLLPSYISCTSHTYFSIIPDFLIQYHSSSLGTLLQAFSRSTHIQCLLLYFLCNFLQF